MVDYFPLNYIQHHLLQLIDIVLSKKNNEISNAILSWAKFDCVSFNYIDCNAW